MQSRSRFSAAATIPTSSEGYNTQNEFLPRPGLFLAGTRVRPSAFPLRPQLKKNAQGAVEAPSRQPGKPAAGLPICTCGKQKELLL
jgi:hypothetical protein